jgi:hypothetical protein
MSIPTGENWARNYGHNLDPLHMLEAFEDGEPLYGIPSVLRQPIPRPLPPRLMDWANRCRREPGEGLHFFVDDYRFEPAWNHPGRYAPTLANAPLVLSPDFSIFHDKPRATQIWNTYRARWLARKFQEFGAMVVPSVSWGDASSYGFAFLGIPEGSCVALSTVGRKKAGTAWDEGYQAMLDAIDPELVFCVGPLMGEDLERLAEVKYYESYMMVRLAELRAKQRADRVASTTIVRPGGRYPRTIERSERWAAEEAEAAVAAVAEEEAPPAAGRPASAAAGA